MKWIITLSLLLSLVTLESADRRRALLVQGTAAGGGAFSVPLLLHYTFSEQTGGTAADSSGNGYTGTLNADTTWGGTDTHGPFVTFDGTGDSITRASVALNTSGDSSITISVWVRPASTSSGFRCVWRPADGSVANFATYQDNGNNWRYYENGSDVTDGPVSAGTWYHLLIRQPTTSGNAQFWINGVNKGTAGARRTMATANWYLGNDEFGQGFIGDIANFRIYAGAITDGEIATLAAQ